MYNVKERSHEYSLGPDTNELKNGPEGSERYELKPGDNVEILESLKEYEVFQDVVDTIGEIGKVIQCFDNGDCRVQLDGIDRIYYYRSRAIRKVGTESSSELDELGLPLRPQSEDIINHPSHYTFFKKEIIDTIRDSLTPEEFIGYLKGNMIKYRMRAGIKGGIEKRKEDLDKSNWYQDKLNSLS
jgi:hypothetical protein